LIIQHNTTLSQRRRQLLSITKRPPDSENLNSDAPGDCKNYIGEMCGVVLDILSCWPPRSTATSVDTSVHVNAGWSLGVSCCCLHFATALTAIESVQVVLDTMLLNRAYAQLLHLSECDFNISVSIRLSCRRPLVYSGVHRAEDQDR